MNSIRNRLNFVAISLFAAVGGSAASAADLLVPSQYSTIQSAIDIASAGDTVLVNPGHYVEVLDFHGKGITVKSVGGASVTVIEKNPLVGTGAMTSSPVVIFNSHETRTSVLNGFTITKGTGVFSSLWDCNCDGYQLGGGIFINQASPIISDCVIKENFCFTYFSRGGGIFSESGSPLIVRCRIENNQAGGGYGRGGGLWLNGGSPEILDCVVKNNQSNSYWYGFGAGIWIESGQPLLQRVMITNNTSSHGIGGLQTTSGTRLQGVYVGSNNSLPLVSGNFINLGNNILNGDCNNDLIPDHEQLLSGYLTDIDDNGRPDECDAQDADIDHDGILNEIDNCPQVYNPQQEDCDGNGVGDACELDCNHNGIPDSCDIANGTAKDCNGNGIPDSCDIASGLAKDCNSNGIPDSCEILSGAVTDINGNNIPDSCDVVSGLLNDYNHNGIADSAELMTVTAQLQTVTSQFNAVTAQLECGDLNNDGSADSQDLGLLLLRYGACQADSLTTVQEPLILQSVETPTPVLNKK